MTSKYIRQRGTSLIEVSMVIILSVFFISAGVYVLSLFKVFAQSYTTASEMNSIRSIINNSDVEYTTGSVYDASEITGDEKLNKYTVYFGDDDYALISGNTTVSMDVFYITCYLAKNNCGWIVNNKLKHMSAVLPSESLATYGIDFSGTSYVLGILFRRD